MDQYQWKTLREIDPIYDQRTDWDGMPVYDYLYFENLDSMKRIAHLGGFKFKEEADGFYSCEFENGDYYCKCRAKNPCYVICYVYLDFQMNFVRDKNK